MTQGFVKLGWKPHVGERFPALKQSPRPGIPRTEQPPAPPEPGPIEPPVPPPGRGSARKKRSRR